jgi:hypothetical protein
VKMETYVNMLGEPEFDVYTDHLPLLKVLEHHDATKLRTMQHTVIERQLAYIAQFPTLQLQYVKGPSNLADVFTCSPFVCAPTLEAMGLAPTESPELVARIYNVHSQEEAQRVLVLTRPKRGQKKKEATPGTPRQEPALEMEQLFSALKDIKKEEVVSAWESNLGEAETPIIQAVPPKDKDEVTSSTPESALKAESEQTLVPPVAAEVVIAPSESTAVAPRMVPVDSHGQEMVSETSPAARKDATDPRRGPPTLDQRDERTPVVARQGKSLFWDETRSSVRLDVFNLDVFELVAIERLSGRDTPNQYNTALFKEMLSDVEQHLPHLELRSGRLYHTETPTGYNLLEVVKDDVYWASHAAPTGGHYGHRGTMKRLEGITWRPHISANIKRMVDTCELCMRNKAARPPGRYHQSRSASECTSTSSSWRWKLPRVSTSSLRPSTVRRAGSPARPCTRGRPSPSVSGSTTAGYSSRGYRNKLPSTARARSSARWQSVCLIFWEYIYGLPHQTTPCRTGWRNDRTDTTWRCSSAWHSRT